MNQVDEKAHPTFSFGIWLFPLIVFGVFLFSFLNIIFSLFGIFVTFIYPYRGFISIQPRPDCRAGLLLRCGAALFQETPSQVGRRRHHACVAAAEPAVATLCDERIDGVAKRSRHGDAGVQQRPRPAEPAQEAQRGG